MLLQFVIAGHSRSKNGVASLAYDPAIHTAVSLLGFAAKPLSLHVTMDARVKPAHDDTVVDLQALLCHNPGMRFEILGAISEAETFASGSGIRELARLRRIYGRGRWRKRKGIARIRLVDRSIHLAEIHWYEASGIGRKEFKIKRLIGN